MSWCEAEGRCTSSKRMAGKDVSANPDFRKAVQPARYSTSALGRAQAVCFASSAPRSTRPKDPAGARPASYQRGRAVRRLGVHMSDKTAISAVDYKGAHHMQFKEALKKAGLPNPGRTTWCGKATDGTAVFTIWSHEVRRLDQRLTRKSFAVRDAVDGPSRCPLRRGPLQTGSG
jgi:hypothetical protein